MPYIFIFCISVFYSNYEKLLTFINEESMLFFEEINYSTKPESAERNMNINQYSQNKQ